MIVVLDERPTRIMVARIRVPLPCSKSLHVENEYAINKSRLCYVVECIPSYRTPMILCRHLFKNRLCEGRRACAANYLIEV